MSVHAPRTLSVTLSILLALVGLALSTLPAATPTSHAAQAEIIAVAAGVNHSCALTSNGGVKCWGDNYYGQLGDGTTISRGTPVPVSGLSSGVTALAANLYHSCALTSNGGVKCWGYNAYGQLGDGTTTSSNTPVAVSGLAGGVTALAAGLYHSCALTSSGGVTCWGQNYNGQLGDGTTTSSNTPVPVSGLAGDVTALAAGGLHNCALTSSGGVTCWGANSDGQLGDGTTNYYSNTPVAVSGLAGGVNALATGRYHSCALTSSGGVTCWGQNYNGQLGDGTTTRRSTPVAVSGLSSGVTALTAGVYHGCVLTSSGVKCWGDNYYGQLGDGTTIDRSTPVPVSGLADGVNALAAGGYHSCALVGGGLQCWGYNYNGQLGDGTTINRSTPVDVLFPVPPTFTSSAPAAGVFGSAYSHSFTADGPAPITFSLSDGSLPPGLAFNAGTLSGTPAQAGTFNFTISAANGFGQVDQPVTLQIAPASQSITFAPLSNQTYGADPVALNASASSELAVSFNSSTPAVCAVSDSSVTLLAAGDCTIAAAQAGTTNYSAAPQVSRSFNIEKAALSVSANDKQRSYGADNPAFDGVLNGVVGADGISATYATSANGSSPVNTYTIIPTLQDPNHKLANYTVSSTNGTLSVQPALLTITAADQVRRIGQPNPVFNALYSGFVNAEDQSVLSGAAACTSSATPNSPAQTYAITCTAGTLSAANYSFQFAPGTLTVSDKDIPVLSWTTPAAIAYGTALGSEQLNATAHVNDTPLPGSFSYDPPAGSVLPVGTGTILNVTFTPADSANYAVVSKQVQVNISKALLTVTARNRTMTQGRSSMPALEAAISGFVNDEDQSVLSGAPSCTSDATLDSAAGEYSIDCTQGTLVAANYRFGFVAGTLTISARPGIVISHVLPQNGQIIIIGQTKAFRPIKVTITPSATQLQGESVSYTTTADANGQWSVDSARAIPMSGGMPSGGFPLGTHVSVMAEVQDSDGVAVESTTMTSLLSALLIPMALG